MKINSSICDDGNLRLNAYIKTSALTLIVARSLMFPRSARKSLECSNRLKLCFPLLL